MAFFDRVKETTTTTGTGDITLSGTSPTGYRTFDATFGVGSPIFWYAIISSDESEWEVGYGNLSASTTLLRSGVSSSSNGNNLVNFSAGTKTVFNTIAADTFSSIQSTLDYYQGLIDALTLSSITRGKAEAMRLGANML